MTEERELAGSADEAAYFHQGLRPKIILATIEVFGGRSRVCN